MTARWRTLADKFIAEIQSGERRPGSLMPPIRKLVEEWGPGPALTAMRTLRDEGWTVTVPGSGTFVADPLPGPKRDLEARVAELEARIDRHERGHR